MSILSSGLVIGFLSKEITGNVYVRRNICASTRDKGLHSSGTSRSEKLAFLPLSLCRERARRRVHNEAILRNPDKTIWEGGSWKRVQEKSRITRSFNTRYSNRTWIVTRPSSRWESIFRFANCNKSVYSFVPWRALRFRKKRTQKKKKKEGSEFISFEQIVDKSTLVFINCNVDINNRIFIFPSNKIVDYIFIHIRSITI